MLSAALRRTKHRGFFVSTLSHPPMDSMPPTSPSVVSVRRASALLGVPRAKVSALVYTGLLPSTPVGNSHVIAVSDLERIRAERPELFPTAA